MKRILSVFLCIALIGILVFPVSAAGNAHMSLSAAPATVYRGDTFTISVFLTNDQTIGRGGIVLSYNTAVFEFVGGSCNVSGATLAEVSAGRNGGVFAMETAQAVSGTIFTIQMRVRSDAPFGTYTVSGSPSMEIPCGISGVSVTVACKHSYGAYTAVDSGSHRRQCAICQAYETTAHNWDSGTVTLAATCKDPGTMLYTCKDCGQTTTETISPNNNHQYRNWTYVDESGHRGTCAVCGRTASAAHYWEFVEVIQEPSCTVAGTQSLKCDTCGHEKTESIPVIDHSYGAFEAVDGKSHSHACVDCGHEEMLDHRYSDQYNREAQGHSLLCDDCGAPQELEAHIPGPEATADEPQVCTACGWMLKAALNHVHSYRTEWSTDENGHWYVCEYCEDRTQQQFHSFDSVCDDTCDICGYVREPAHDYSDLLVSDETGHYYPCRGCEAQKDFAPHSPGEAATIQTAQNCTVCGYELAPRLPHEHVYTVEDGMHHHTCICGAVTNGVDEKDCEICAMDAQTQFENFPWYMVAAVEAVLLVAAAVALVMMKKQK